MKREEEINDMIKDVLGVLRKNKATKIETFGVLESIKLIIFSDVVKGLEE